MYGFCNGNFQVIIRECQRRFSGRTVSHRSIFINIHFLLHNSGSFRSKNEYHDVRSVLGFREDISKRILNFLNNTSITFSQLQIS